jgi:hypothetical protein
MTEQNKTPDEQVYESNKDEPEIKRVYDHDPQGAQLPAEDHDQAELDEMVEETFPASDPTTTTPTVPGIRSKQTDK